MWIRTQNKHRLVNTDQIIDIFIDKTGTKIMAETTRDGDFFTLGEYENRDDCMKVLNEIQCRIEYGHTIRMPAADKVNDWIS